MALQSADIVVCCLSEATRNAAQLVETALGDLCFVCIENQSNTNQIGQSCILSENGEPCSVYGYVRAVDKPYCLVKMCQKFDHLESMLAFAKEKKHEKWMPGSPMPLTLRQVILRKAEIAKTVHSSKSKARQMEFNILSKIKLSLDVVKREYGEGEVFTGEINHLPDGSEEKKSGELVSPKHGTRYVGEFQTNNRREGVGICYYLKMGHRYEGEWLDDLPHGWGVKYYEDGQRYEGGWEGGRWNGKGLHCGTNGIYDGDFVNNIRHGFGSFQCCCCAERYLGEFKDDQYDGKGTLFHNDGCVSVCEFKQNKREGKGTCTLVDGRRYEGEFRNNVFHGKGVMKYSDGSYVSGEWKHDKLNGSGVHQWADGEKFVGVFKNGQRSEGLYTWPDGKSYKGSFKNGQPNGFGVFIYPDGEKYEGMVKDSMPHGKGTKVSPDGTVYCGAFREGMFEGKGELQRSDGSRYVGEFKHGTLCGSGCMIFNDGVKYVGRWKDGKPCGKGAYKNKVL